MDEAERCTRLAILDAGRIVADGTPQQLMERLPGRTWLIESPDPRGAKEALADLPGVIALAQIGTALRMLAASEESIEQRVAERLRSASVEGSLHAVAPNLEDVFVAATRKAPRAA